MNSLTKIQKSIILSLLLVIIGLLLFLILNDDKNAVKTVEPTNYGSKTVMIYIAGNDLESQNYIATGDIGVVNPSSIDLSKINVVMYTGGTKKWHNFVSNDENGVYKLKSEGFVKVKSFEQKNMGDAKTLSEFLNYAYENYPADSYDMMFYGHGSGIKGSTLDENTQDDLSLEDFAIGFNNSPFKNKKLDVVIFRSCLNGTLEFATLFKNYAKYMVASEEVSLGHPYFSVFHFMNKINVNDDGLELGKKFVDGYQEFLSHVPVDNTSATTYSIIDLSKVQDIIDNLNEFASKIDLNIYYNAIANARSNLFQYGTDVKDFDTVDLYTMVKNVSEITKVDGSKVLNSINNAVVYNKTNEQSSMGLSIYFPYNGNSFAVDLQLNGIYPSIVSLKDYGNFITKFNNMKNSQESFAFSFSKGSMSASSSTNEAKLVLTDEQKAVYSSATFSVFRRVKDHPNYYTPLLTSNNVTLNDNVLSANIDNNLIKWYDVDDGIEKAEYISVVEDIRSNIKSKSVAALISGIVETDEILNQVNIEIGEENGNLFFKNAKLKSRNERVNGIYIDIDSSEYISILTGRYKILDSKGKYTNEWESSPTIIGNEMKPKNVRLIKTGLDENEEYYCLFAMKDINNNIYYSDLIKVGE